MVAVRFQSFEDFIKETFRIFNKPLRSFKRSIKHYGNQDFLTFLWDEGWFARLHSLDDGNCLIFTQCAGPLKRDNARRLRVETIQGKFPR